MNALLWTLVVCYSLSILIHLYYLATGKRDEPTSPGARAAVVVIDMCFIAWAGYLLLKG